MLNSVVVGWLLRRVMELGGIGTALVTAYMALDPASQAAIGRILTGEWKEVPLGTIVGILLALYGYVTSFRKTVQPSVVTKVDGKVVEVAEKDLPMTTKDAIKTSAPIAAEKKSAGKTLFEHLGIFR